MRRRAFVTIIGGGLAGILASRRAPAFAQATRIHLLHWPNFIPDADVELRRQVTEYNRQMKTDVFKWFEISYGFDVGATPFWENHALWNTVDDAMKPYRYTGRGSRMMGFAGPASARAGEVYSKYVTTDMYAKAVQGMAPEDAVRWAESELKRIYEA